MPISKSGRLRLGKWPNHTDSKGQSENHSFIQNMIAFLLCARCCEPVSYYFKHEYLSTHPTASELPFRKDPRWIGTGFLGPWVGKSHFPSEVPLEIYATNRRVLHTFYVLSTYVPALDIQSEQHGHSPTFSSFIKSSQRGRQVRKPTQHSYVIRNDGGGQVWLFGPEGNPGGLPAGSGD